MPSDPSIILASNAATGANWQQDPTQNILRMLDAAQAYKANQLQYQQQLQAVQKQNAILDLYRQPLALDLKSGIPTSDTLAKINQIDPTYGMKVTDQVSQIENANALRQQRIDEAHLKGRDDEADAISEANIVYQDDLTKGLPQDVARTKFLDAMKGFYDGRQGVPSQQNQSDYARVASMSPEGWSKLALSQKQYVAANEFDRRAGETGSDVTLTLPNGGRMNGFIDKLQRFHNENGDIVPIPQGARVERIATAMDPQAAGFAETRLDQGQERIDLSRQIAAGTDGGLDHNTLDFAAQQVLDGNPMPNLGFGAAGAKAKIAILRRAAELGAQDSGSARAAGAQAIETHADIRATSSALTAIERQKASVGQFAPTALGLADKITGMMGRATTQYGPEWLAKAMGDFRKGQFGDPTVAEFRTYITDLQSENAKIMAGSTGSVAQVSAHNQDMMNSILNGSMPASEIPGAIQGIKSGIQLRQRSILEEEGQLRGQLRSQAGPPSSSQTGQPYTGTAPPKDYPTAQHAQDGKWYVKHGNSYSVVVE